MCIVGIGLLDTARRRTYKKDIRKVVTFYYFTDTDAFTNFIYLEMVVIVVWRAELPVDARNYAGRAEAEQNTGTNPWLVAQPY